ncbi:MAG: IS3 family transposase [Gemmataceae bacterium]
MERSSFYYTSKTPETDDGVRATVVKIAAEFPSYGYRMIRGELRRRGFDVNAKRVRRLMRVKENLVIQVRRFVATSELLPSSAAAGRTSREKPGDRDASTTSGPRTSRTSIWAASSCTWR